MLRSYLWCLPTEGGSDIPRATFLEGHTLTLMQALKSGVLTCFLLMLQLNLKYVRRQNGRKMPKAIRYRASQEAETARITCVTDGSSSILNLIKIN